LMHRSNIEGLPILQPLFAIFQNDEKVYNDGFNFMVGNDLLVSNVLEKGVNLHKIYFPKGSDFYEINNRKKYKGGNEYEIDVELDSIPMFIREGGIILSSKKQLFNLKSEKVTD